MPARGDVFTVPKVRPGDQIVTITLDGDVIINPTYTTVEAARAFWDAVKALMDADGFRVREGG